MFLSCPKIIVHKKWQATGCTHHMIHARTYQDQDTFCVHIKQVASIRPVLAVFELTQLQATSSVVAPTILCCAALHNSSKPLPQLTCIICSDMLHWHWPTKHRPRQPAWKWRNVWQCCPWSMPTTHHHPTIKIWCCRMFIGLAKIKSVISMWFYFQQETSQINRWILQLQTEYDLM